MRLPAPAFLFPEKNVLILGNGGTSLTARKAISDQGAAQILIASRRGESGCISYEDLKSHRDVEVIINTTPVGTYPDNGKHLIELSEFPACGGVIDVIYNPFKTVLLQQAEELKNSTFQRSPHAGCPGYGSSGILSG